MDMAEKDTGTQGAVPINRPSEVTEVVGSAEELVRQAPDPTNKGGKIYQVAYPIDQFVVEGQPVVNTTGVRLTDAQAKEILPAAEASGVKIVEVKE
jgi:hypothetical protein